MRYFAAFFLALYICAGLLHAQQPQNGQQLSASEKQHTGKRGTPNPEAYALYLKGRSYYDKRTLAGLETAISYFNQAIAKDPRYAMAYAGLAYSYGRLPDFGASASENIPKSDAAARKALELDPTLARPHVTLAANMMAHEWNFAAGMAEFKKALELDPNNADAHETYAENLALIGGREQEALAEINRAHQLAPRSPAISAVEANIDIYARRFDEAIAVCKRVSKEDPAFAGAHYSLALAYWGKRMYSHVIEELKAYDQLSGDTQDSEITSAMESGLRSGDWNGALAKGVEAMLRLRKTGYSAYNIAVMYAAAGHKEQAFQWLNTALQEHDENMIALKTDFTLDPIRSDPRFAELVRKVGLPQP